MRLRDLPIAAALLFVPAAAQAHPHQWVDVAAEVLFDPQGRIAAIRHHWRFDEAYSAFAIQGLDANGDGAYSPDELQPLARENVESLNEFDFFTLVLAGDYQAGYGAPTAYGLDLDDGKLTLHFTLPLAQPLFARGEVLIQVYDPTYYIAMVLPGPDAVRLVDAPPGCRLQVFPAQGPDAAAAEALATVGPGQRELPAAMQDLATGIDNSAEVNCGGPTVAAAGADTAASGDAGDAARRLADAAPGRPADLREMPTPDAAKAAPPPRTPAARSGLLGRLAALQTGFNQKLTESLSALKADGAAFWWLGGFSFLYGIVHAAGPGHGKVVISSYLLANEARLQRGIVIAAVSALLQALVAVAIVGLLAVLLGMTSMAMTRTAGFLETGSFALVAGLGLYLLATKGRRAWTALRGGDPHAHHRHRSDGVDHSGHRHAIRWDDDPTPAAQRSAAAPSHRHTPQGCSCGGHHAAPEQLEKPGLAGAAAAVLSVGLRPCSGALVVLVFALAQGIFWAGVASTFLMALGTAITVAALAALAVGAKGLAGRLAGGDGRRAAQAMLALELAAAAGVTALGVTLFAGSLAT